MLIRMRAYRVMQDAGRERPLNVDEVYDLPDVLAHAFIATGVASPESPHETREVSAHDHAPENKTRGRR